MSNILIEDNEHVRVLTINRPEKLNALNRQTIQDLSNAFKDAETDKNIRCIVVTGAGEKAFVAGADISEFASFSVEEGQELARKGQEILFDLVENLNTPVIAAVNGFALGGGLELAMSAHIRVASDNARMGLPEVSLGVIPGYGGTQRLAQLIGKGRANELVMTAGMVKADRAYEMGLVNHVVPQPELMAKALEIGEAIAKNSPTAISSAIRSVNAGFKEGVDGYLKEIKEFGICFGTSDFKEGTEAFLQKRKPSFTGE